MVGKRAPYSAAIADHGIPALRSHSISSKSYLILLSPVLSHFQEVAVVFENHGDAAVSELATKR
jgi:hypothetical protein